MIRKPRKQSDIMLPKPSNGRNVELPKPASRQPNKKNQ